MLATPYGTPHVEVAVANARRFLDAVLAIPNGTLVAIAVSDHACGDNGAGWELLAEAMRSLGAMLFVERFRPGRQLRFAYAGVLCKGAPPGRAWEVYGMQHYGAPESNRLPNGSPPAPSQAVLELGAQDLDALLQRSGVFHVGAVPGAFGAAVADAFECAFCLDTCVDPCSAPCGHNFCLDHLRSWITGKAGATCPTCRTPLPAAASLRVNVGIRDAIAAARLLRLPPVPAAGGGGGGGAAAAAAAHAAPPIAYEDLAFELSRRGQRVELGRGAFASVYAATYRGEAVAVKALALPAGANLAAVERALWAEADVQYRVRHDAVVPLLGVCVDREVDGGPPTELALVMPRLARSLEAALVGGGGVPAPPLAQRLGWLRDVARALRFLHASGIVHGDLKPANVLLDARGGARVCDFGHARLRGDDAAASASLGGGAGGTPRYRDAAVCAGRSALRKASDVYSFGVLAWEVLSGEVPFAGLDVGALLAHVSGGGRPPLGALPAALPARVAAAVPRCWADAQADRPTAAEVCAALEE
jgi:hypothetical protein